MRHVIPMVALFFSAGCGGGQSSATSTSTSTSTNPDTAGGEVPCAAEITEPVVSVQRYAYHGEEVYYYTMECCDMFNVVHRESDCSYVCAPDGGFGGTGDGGCPTFFDDATPGPIVWP